jgi:hypothetical protein
VSGILASDISKLAVADGGYFREHLIFDFHMSFIHLALARKKREEKEDKVMMASRSGTKIYVSLLSGP